MKNKITKIFYADITVVLVCFIGAFFSFYLFYNDINRTLSRLNEEPVGIITFRYNTAQRRFIDRVIWDRLKNESPVYNGDVIRTADLSEAEITFESGDIIGLSSNTLVQIFADADGSRIDLSGGGISVNVSASGEFVITAGEQTVTLEGGTVMNASINDDSIEGGGLGFAVSEGKAVFRRAGADAAPPVSVNAGSGLRLNAAGQASASPQAVAVTPPPNAKFLAQSPQGTSVNFNWNTNNYPAGGITRFEIASDRNFNRIHFAEDFSGDNCILNLPQGDWFWRLYPSTEMPRNIQYSKLSVVNSRAPSAISPQEGQVISYYNSFPQVRFQWTSSAQAQSYLLEAANNPSMNNPALSVQVRGSGNVISYNAASLGRGDWYWRVTPVYGREFTASSQGGVSAVRQFSIERTVNLSAPVLIAPAQDAFLNIENGRRDILFTWRRENANRGFEAASYTIRISNNRNMTSPVIEQTVTETFYRYGSQETAVTAGTWYWTVSQTDSEGNVSPASNPRSFNALQGEIVQRAVFPPDTYTIADSLLPFIRFTWKTNLSNTRFQVSDNERFATLLIDENAAGEAYTIRSLRNGTYYWRITGMAGTQRRESAPRRFTIVPSLPAPALIRPDSLAAAHDGSIVILEGQPLVFNWHSSQGAEYYAFRLYKDNRAVNESTVYGSSHTVNMSNYGDGGYMLEVQGFAGETPLSTRRPGLTATMPLNIIYLRPVSLVNPGNGTEYTGINASRNPDTIRWTSPVIPADAELIIAKDRQMSDIVLRRANPPQAFVMPRLSAGDYYWTVCARTEGGLDISAVSPSRFKVLPIPPLPAPQNRRPANRFTVTMAMYTESRSLNFSWDGVQGANGYILTIFRGTGSNRQTILQTPVLTRTNYTVEDLRSIGRGNFFWQAEAVFVINDFIEQRGILQENSLIMNIPIPERIETLDTGVLYGN